MDFRWLGVILGMNWPWNGGGVLLEDRVRLGDEFGMGLKELEGLGSMEKKRRKSSDFCKGRGGECRDPCSLDALSLKVMKRCWKDRKTEALSGGGKELGTLRI